MGKKKSSDKKGVRDNAAARYLVADGMAITTIRGIVASGGTVVAADFRGDHSVVEALVEGGVLVPVEDGDDSSATSEEEQ